MRVDGFRYRDEWIPNYYPAHEIDPEHFLRISRTGQTQILNADQNRQLDEVFMDETLFERLERTGHIVTDANSQQVFGDLKTWHNSTYDGPGLHLVAITKRCNLDCTYCHMRPEAIGADPNVFDMKPETAEAIIEFALASPNPRIDFEFQGGEPFLHFPGIVHFVETAKRANKTVGKKIGFSVVTNLMVVREEHLAFCKEHHVGVSFTVNGPKDIHDHFRQSRSGAGSYDTVAKRLRTLGAKYPRLLQTAPLCVVGAHNAKDLIRTVEFFHDEGFKSVAILKLRHLGNTVDRGIEFDIREFLKHYIAALDHIYEKNRRTGENFNERLLQVVFSKVISRSDVPFVDWRNPCGDFSSAITYDYDGEILPSDETRSLRSAFGLGNVKDKTYDELVRQRSTFHTMNLSLRDRDATCRECAFNPYCGVLPVLDYARTGDATPRPHESEECLQTMAVLEWMFAKMVEDPLPLFRMVPGMEKKLRRLARDLAA